MNRVIEVLLWLLAFAFIAAVVEVGQYLSEKRRRKREDAEMRQEMRRRV